MNRRVIHALAFVGTCSVVTACSSESTTPQEPLPWTPQVEQSCFAPDELGGSPTDTTSFLALVNAMPRPLTLPCLLQTFDRPLEIDATRNTFSAQPAYGPNNPRMFIYLDDFVISVVPKGEARHLLEFGHAITPTRSIKGEIEFPVVTELAASAPFDRIRDDVGTRCAFCHFSETLTDEIDGAEAYISDIVPIARYQRVDLDYIRWSHEKCDRTTEADRCDMFDGVLAFGEVLVHTD